MERQECEVTCRISTIAVAVAQLHIRNSCDPCFSFVTVHVWNRMTARLDMRAFSVNKRAM
jgi:hypothetical protein